MNYFLIVFVSLMLFLGGYFIHLQNQNHNLILENAKLLTTIETLTKIETEALKKQESALENAKNQKKRLDNVSKNLETCESTLESYNNLITAF